MCVKKVHITARISEPAAGIIRDHAEDTGRSVSAEVGLALEAHALAVVLASLYSPGVEQLLGQDEVQHLRGQIYTDLARKLAESLPHRIPVVDLIDPDHAEITAN
jgi:hypothetical protein